MHRRIGGWVVVVLAAAACSGGGDAPGPTPTLEVTAPTSVVTSGDGGVTLTASYSGSADAIVWSILTAGTPGEVGTITGNGGSALYVPPPALAQDRDVVVQAAAGDLADTFTIHVAAAPPAGIAVSGTVWADRTYPVVGATVIVGGESRTTGPDGAFAFDAVQVPYDAVVIAPDRLRVREYRGLTSTSPALDIQIQPRSTWAEGTVLGGAAEGYARKVFGPSTSFGQESVEVDPFTDGYGFRPSWVGGTSKTVTLRALELSYTGGFGRFGEQAVTLTEGVSSMFVDIALGSPVESAHVTGTIVPPAGIADPRFRVTARSRFGVGDFIPVVQASPSAPSFDVLVPLLPGAGLELVVFADDPGGGFSAISTVTSPGALGALALAERPVPLSPPSTAGYGTTFEWTSARADGVHTMSVTCPSLWITIYGGPTSARIPDLSAYGVAPIAGETCRWSPVWSGYSLEDLTGGPDVWAARTGPVEWAQAGASQFVFTP